MAADDRTQPVPPPPAGSTPTATLPTARPAGAGGPAALPGVPGASGAPGAPGEGGPPLRPRGGPTTRSLAWLVRLVAGVLATLLVLGVMSGLVGPMITKEDRQEQALPVGMTSLRVAGGTGSVQVRAADPGERPSLVRTTRWSFVRPEVSVSTAGDEVVASSECRSGPFSNPCETRWVLVVPEGTQVGVDLDVGEIRVAGTSGDVDVQTDVGEIRVVGTTAERVTARADVGSVRVVAASPVRSADVSTDVGEAVLVLPRGSERYRVDVQADVGSPVVEVDDDPTADRSVTVSSSVGDARVQYAD